ncbi:serine/threonine-protein kinase [Scopulibacillus darangshiensis]|uniref:Serine/threonine-protein kinase n=1 Tax=Scopulibacillus darangshiensis TaxID=442528 RepID=A0A4R2NLT7_9BACL|nr:serine/threonine-protein kinase [Scopulibacillus darangshiensis]TCP22530.1 serine/threonine-protein kinase [Scopulibacillus darangshiensis]
MMNHTTKKSDIKLAPGTLITGKWYGQHYQIIKLLGSGAQGTVYLAQSSSGRVAVKFGKDRSSLTSEVNVLRRFEKVQGEPLGPSLYGVDDWVCRSGKYNFYVMEYIRGTSLLDTVKVRGFEWACIFMLQLLGDLDRLHKEGWIFGDLKPENLIVENATRRIRWLDVGGTTLMGRSVKEYTEFFDRGYWGCGSRKAEPSYDLFAAAMILIYAAEKRRFEKNQQPQKQLFDYIRNQPKLSRFESVLTGAIAGKYTTAEMMKKDLLSKMSETSSCAIRSTNRSRSDRHQRRRKRKSWTGTVMLTVVLAAAYIIYLMIGVM